MACFSVPCPKISLQLAQSNSNPTRPLLPRSSLHNSLAFQASNWNPYKVLRVSTRLNAVSIEKPSNSAAVQETKSEEKTKVSSQDSIADVATITAFMNQVSDLVELVDSRDIMELQLKQKNCEVLIRKKEALPQPPAAPYFMMQSPPPQAMMAPPQSPPAKAAPASPTASPKALPAPSTAAPKSSHPPLKCPMAGTFYRCPSPGAPPLVKVGDKVQKGQVICIIEAMKLMNDIEADHAGTVVDILVEDGKPVSVDTPLFVIEP